MPAALPGARQVTAAQTASFFPSWKASLSIPSPACTSGKRRKDPHGAATDGDRVGAEGEEERRGNKKQTKNKQQRPSESPGGRRHVKPRDAASSRFSSRPVPHRGYQGLPEATRPGGREERSKSHTPCPLGPTRDNAFPGWL